MNQKPLDEARTRKALEDAARRVDEQQLVAVVEREEEFQQKLEDVPGAFDRLVNQARLLFEMLMDYWRGAYRQAPWGTMAMAVAALIYFLTPIDLLPDFLVGIGFVDDAFVVAMVFQALGQDLRTYCHHKGYDLTHYFDDQE